MSQELQLGEKPFKLLKHSSHKQNDNVVMPAFFFFFDVVVLFSINLFDLMFFDLMKAQMG